MIGIPFIKELFKNILQQSNVIEGRFHLCSHWAREINNINVDEVLPNAVPTAKKYPTVLLMPPFQRGQFHLTEQQAKDSVEIGMLFLTPAHYTGQNRVNRPTASNQSKQTIDETWNEMDRAARDFMKVLDQVIMDAGIQNTVYIDDKSPQSIVPVSEMGNDKASGVYLKFSLALSTSCEVSDYDAIELARSIVYAPGSDALDAFKQSVVDFSKKTIIVGTDGNSVTDSWMGGKDIQLLMTNGQSYLEGVNFTQDGTTITGIDITFYQGQKIIVMI